MSSRFIEGERVFSSMDLIYNIYEKLIENEKGTSLKWNH
jgi:hypothetical protein